MSSARDNSQKLETSDRTDEAGVIASALAGSAEAFSDLVERYQSNVRACLVVRLRNPHDAEDLAQETFITAFNKLRDFDPAMPFGPWVRGIAFNLLRNFQKKNRPIAIGAENELAGLIDARIAERSTPQQESQLFTALEDCMEKLDPNSRKLLRRRYHDDAAVKDIAEETGRNHSTVTMQLHRLRGALADCIRNHGETKP